MSIRTDLASLKVGEELERLFQDMEYKPQEAHSESKRVRRDISTVQRQIKRLEQAYESGAYTPEEFAEKRKQFNARLAVLNDEQKQAEEEHRRQLDRQFTVSSMKDLDFIGWVENEQPAVVKFHLSRVVKLIAFPDKSIKAEFI